jgi:hypothetical protein
VMVLYKILDVLLYRVFLQYWKEGHWRESTSMHKKAFKIYLNYF